MPQLSSLFPLLLFSAWCFPLNFWRFAANIISCKLVSRLQSAFICTKVLSFVRSSLCTYDVQYIPTYLLTYVSYALIYLLSQHHTLKSPPRASNRGVGVVLFLSSCPCRFSSVAQQPGPLVQYSTVQYSTAQRYDFSSAFVSAIAWASRLASCSHALSIIILYLERAISAANCCAAAGIGRSYLVSSALLCIALHWFALLYPTFPGKQTYEKEKKKGSILSTIFCPPNSFHLYLSDVLRSCFFYPRPKDLLSTVLCCVILSVQCIKTAFFC